MKTHRNRRGVATFWIALTFTIVFAFVGLAVDAGYMVVVAQKLQHAADASALAAAQLVMTDPDGAHQAAIDLALANSAGSQSAALSPNPTNDPDGDIVIGYYDRDTSTFTPTLNSPNAVKVVARRTAGSPGGAVPLLFGSIFGVNEAGFQRTAIAMTTPSGGSDAGLIVLNENDSEVFEVQGNVVVDIRSQSGGKGSIQINSDDRKAIKAQGNAKIYADELNIVADPANKPASRYYSGEWNPGSPLMPAPLAELPTPTDWGPDYGEVSYSSNDVATISPGYYSGGLEVQGNAVITMNPGIYVIDGKGLNIQGNADISGDGILFYVVGGKVELQGNGDIVLDPPPSGDYEGLLLWQDADNDEKATVQGNGDLLLGGVIYFPGALVEVEGNGESFGTMLICDKLMVQGNGTVRVNMGGEGPIGGDQRIFLVK